MKISLAKARFDQTSADVLAVCVAGPKPEDDLVVQELDGLLQGVLTQAIRAEEFKGEPGSSLSLVAPAGIKAKRVLLLGIGTGELSVPRCREFAVLAARAAMERSSLALVAPASDGALVEALADGLLTGVYRYTRYLTGDRVPKRSLSKAWILVEGRPGKSQQDAVARGRVTAEAVNLARDLVNAPPNDLTATALANTCRDACKALSVQCKVLDKKGIERLGMPLLLAVNRGSTEEPRFIHMTYKPAVKKRVPKVALVGKGLTFDSGGLCLKPPGSMLDMKTDMAGAAVTLGAFVAAAKLALPVEVHGIIGSTDNMVGGAAYRPGDVFPSRKGLSVEIVNTDAEGRLVLADALAYAAELGPDYIIDHATLTGASIVALGPFRAALFASDDGLRQAYERASASTGENLWTMPLDEDLREQLQSPIADLKHTGSRHGGAISAALFLREFVGSIKWAHLDIAGPSYLEAAHHTSPKGGTGFGVATAVEFLRHL